MKLHNVIINDDDLLLLENYNQSQLDNSFHNGNKNRSNKYHHDDDDNQNNHHRFDSHFPMKSSRTNNNKPCLTILKQLNNNENVNNKNENDHHQKIIYDSSYLSYSDAQIVLLQHRMWLQEQIKDWTNNSLMNNNATSPNNHQHDNNQNSVVATSKYHEPNNTITIAIVYLCWNSGDYFLSALSCTSLLTTSYNITNHQTTNTQQRHSTMSKTITILPPILLNTRWSTQEIISVLEFQHSTTTYNNSSCQQQYTLLIYDISMENIAKEVVSALNHHQKHNDYCTHIAKCILLPNFSFDYMTNTPLIEPPLDTADQRKIDIIKMDDTFSKQDAMENLYINNNARDDIIYDNNNIAFIVFTSGTSGKIPKGVLLSHTSILIQSYAKIQSPCSYHSNTKIIGTTVPFFHVGGISSIIAVWMANGTIILPCTNNNINQGGGSFDPYLILHSISLSPSISSFNTADTLVVVPTMLYSIQQIIERNDTSVCIVYPAIQLILIGGQSISSSLSVFLQRTFPNAIVIQTYACTEAASSLTFLQIIPSITVKINQQSSHYLKTTLSGDCVGKPPHHIQLSLMKFIPNLEPPNVMTLISKNVITEPYQVGIIATRGPHVMNGYWNRTLGCNDIHDMFGKNEITVKVKDYWFITNDLGYWDNDGFLYFYGRTSDTIRTGGETVQANEVERIIEQHPYIEECSIFPLKDDQYGEIVACAIVIKGKKKNESNNYNELRCLHNDNDNYKEMIKQWCNEKGLTRYKQPRKVFNVHELPRNSSGKIIKYRLIEQFDQSIHSHRDVVDQKQQHFIFSKL